MSEACPGWDLNPHGAEAPEGSKPGPAGSFRPVSYRLVAPTRPDPLASFGRFAPTGLVLPRPLAIREHGPDPYALRVQVCGSRPS